MIPGKKIGIIGTRRRNTISDYTSVLDAFKEIYEYGDWIVSGGCPKGGDAFAEKISRDFGIPILIHQARWSHEYNDDLKWFERVKMKKYAGFERNKHIAGDSDIIIACVHPDRTGGTEDTLKQFDKIHGIIPSDKKVVLV